MSEKNCGNCYCAKGGCLKLVFDRDSSGNCAGHRLIPPVSQGEIVKPKYCYENPPVICRPETCKELCEVKPKLMVLENLYKKKPVIIKAIQFWNDRTYPIGVCDCTKDENHLGTPHIHTLEGIMDVCEGDWIITGVKGERYPCKADIFSMTYEKVETPPQPPPADKTSEVERDVSTILNKLNIEEKYLQPIMIGSTINITNNPIIRFITGIEQAKQQILAIIKEREVLATKTILDKFEIIVDDRDKTITQFRKEQEK